MSSRREYLDWTFTKYSSGINRRNILDYLERLEYVFNIKLTYDEWKSSLEERYFNIDYLTFLDSLDWYS